ncbi:hypothetical protein ACFYOF_15820 [Streptomyces sp. NPDC007148]|uniref:hypothetical protein n=1 Tax=Streptomyces sp. NPDC007148 TaxID=3364775 RepID=UPI003682DC4A
MALAGGTFHLEVATDVEERPVDPNAAVTLDRCWGHPYDTQHQMGRPGPTNPRSPHTTANPPSPGGDSAVAAVDEWL